MKIGDIVMWRNRSTPTGMAIDMGTYQLDKKVGTVPNLWEAVEVVNFAPITLGRRVRFFAYEEDLLYKFENASYVAVQVKPKLEIVR